MITFSHTGSKALLPLAGAFALAACGQADDQDKTYKADVTDESGGKLIVSEPDPNAVPIDLPETPMTPVPLPSETPETSQTPTE